jgi:hypothetical protein
MAGPCVAVIGLQAVPALILSCRYQPLWITLHFEKKCVALIQTGDTARVLKLL